jgi:hypothetical protein
VQRLAVWVQVHSRGEINVSVCKVDMIGPDPHGVLATKCTKGRPRRNPDTRACTRSKAPRLKTHTLQLPFFKSFSISFRRLRDSA